MDNKNLPMPVEIEGVHGYVDDKGTVWLKLEDAARGLGFIEYKKGVEYIRWRTVRDCLRQFALSQQSAKSCSDADFKDSFIPENIFYRLAMKANSPAANAFQEKIANDILPAIRKHGIYATPVVVEKIMSDPDFLIGVLTAFKQEKAKNAALSQTVKTLTPKAKYHDDVLNSEGIIPVTLIAKDYGMSALRFNRLLARLKIQYKVGSSWALYSQFVGNGYTKTKTNYNVSDTGQTSSHVTMYWTQKGRKFLYDELRKHDVYPEVESLSLEGDFHD